MKKLWLIMLAVALAFGLVFGIAGCRDVPGPVDEATDDLEITDAEEIAKLLTAEGYFGSDTGGCSTDGNVMIFDNVASPDNNGFRLDFPAEAVGYTGLEITFKLLAVTQLDGTYFAKFGFKSAKGTGDVTPYDDHEVIFGTAANVGVEKTQYFSLNAPNKLPNNLVYISHNQHGTGATGGSRPPVSYKVEITKIVFKAGEPVPCCTDCDVATCKDCSTDACEGECGTKCCVNFAGDATTKVELVKGATTALDKIVHTNPALDFSSGVKVSETGVVTMNNYSVVFYKFPEDTSTYKIADYDYIDITYTLSNIVNSAATIALPGTHDNLKVQIRDYKGADGYTFSGGGYQNFGGIDSNVTHTIQTWGDNGTGGFAIRMNSWDVDGSPNRGDGSCAEFIDMKITKIEFRKGTRYTVEFFSPMTPAQNNLPKLTVLSGNGLTTRLPTVSNPGWNFLGWVDGWNPDTNMPAGNDVSGTTPITKNTTLFAKWAFLPPPTDLTITVAGAAVISPVTAVNGSYTYLNDGKGIRYTQKEGNGWDYPVFEINFTGTDRLEDFANISYKTRGVSGDMTYKGIRIIASSTVLTEGEISATSNIIDVTSLGAALGWSNSGIGDGTPATKTLPIDTSAAAAFTGAKIFIAIGLNAPGGAVWEISDIVLSK